MLSMHATLCNAEIFPDEMIMCMEWETKGLNLRYKEKPDIFEIFKTTVQY